MLLQISNKELTLFQQKLEDEVRKDQQEKRDHQERLKVLKGEIKELGDFQDRWDIHIPVNETYSMQKREFGRDG